MWNAEGRERAKTVRQNQRNNLKIGQLLSGRLSL